MMIKEILFGSFLARKLFRRYTSILVEKYARCKTNEFSLLLAECLDYMICYYCIYVSKRLVK